ncbi:uncharacterized protein LOC100370782 [Saccoglossus kowalevskii]|uniref:Uncharacterized protein LOC100370782 n=1 Tax=Saccoglossus kowalevskii TaxID=10224 RepID=A0ABM0MY52_SACKO|nr:PREDICTED: uncharacterized protein LOC100370782 [Saccoglossus kowalevskii]
MADEIQFGDKICNVTDAGKSYIKRHHLNISFSSFCENKSKCENPSYSSYCEWHYTGTGLEYQLLAGPLFAVLFSVTGIPFTALMEKTTVNRKDVIIISITMWSLMGLRGLGLGVFQWGVYIGLGLAFVLDLIVDVLGWRWAYWLCAFPGFILALLTIVTVKEPPRQIANYQVEQHVQLKESPQQPFWSVLFVLVLITSSLRCGGGYNFNYNAANYFRYYYPDYPYEHFMSWIPAVFGILGAFLGGILSDRAALGRGYVGRIYVFSVSILVSIPLSIGVLLLDPPWCFAVMMPNFIAVGMWGCCATSTVVEQAPKGRQTLAMAYYIFSINMLGGNMNVLIPVLKSAIGLRYALLVMYPGMYVLSLCFCLLCIPFAKRKIKAQKAAEASDEDERKTLLGNQVVT